MSIALLTARLLLAVLFLFAGVTKLFNLPATRRAMADFGLPLRMVPLLSMLVPMLELVIALLLVAQSWAWWGAAGALILLLAFTAGMAVNLAQGKKPECHCFGELYSGQIGLSSLARNTTLVLIAGFVVWYGPKDAGFGLTQLTSSQIVSLALALAIFVTLGFQSWLLLHLFRQNGRLMLRLEALEQSHGIIPSTTSARGLAVGTPAPAFKLPNLEGDVLTLVSLRSPSKPTLLIFSDPACNPCNALLPEIGRWQEAHAATLTIALISRGTIETNRAKLEAHKLTNLLVQGDREVSEQYQAHETPAAVMILPDGTIGSFLAEGPQAIRNLITTWARALSPAGNVAGQNGNNGNATARGPSHLKVGDQAPQFELPDLNGRTISLAEFHGAETLILFWNPECGFCKRMLSDLRVWERSATKIETPRLLVIAAGSPEANKEQDFLATVLLDQTFNVGHLFGVKGTPSALLISAEGKIASQVAVGANQVFALAQPQKAQVKSAVA